MKRSLNIQINFNNKAIYTFVAFIALLIIGMGVFAFGTSTPSTFGHSAGELDLSSGVNGVAVFNEAVCIGGICRTSWSSILDKGSVSTSTSPSISRTITLTEGGVITLVGQG